MVLRNLRVIGTNKVINIEIDGKIISRISEHDTGGKLERRTLTFENSVVLPGLINSHDHLDFNLFPQLGTELYNNYTEWAHHIHKQYKDEINAVLRVPEALRVQWGIYKNLLAGVTTVVNHGKRLAGSDYLITVLQNSQSLHSVAFEQMFKLKLNNPLRISKPVAIHVGEGTDAKASDEIDRLLHWNLLRRRLVGIHGVSMNVEQSKRFDALVWCPASNYFLFNRTADIHRLRNHTTICFGSDSTLTTCWDIWQHFRLAEQKTSIDSRELLKMLTVNPSRVWRLNAGAIKEGRDADILVVKAPAKSLFDISPEEILLVVHKGETCLFDVSLLDQLGPKELDHSDFSEIEINYSVKYVKGNIEQLICDIKGYLPQATFPVKPSSKSAPVTL